MKKAYFKLVFFVFLLAIPFLLKGQATKVTGIVKDAETNEVLPFVNIVFKNTTIGTFSEMDGTFSLSTFNNVDTLEVSFLGYQTQTFKLHRNHTQHLEIYLISSEHVLDEIVVLPGENPAHAVFRNIVKNKKQNNPEKIQAYTCEVYNKIQFDANNIGEKMKNRRLMKGFEFVFNEIDTSAQHGKNHLPLFISETLSKFSYQKNPKRFKEEIEAVKISGTENKSISQFMGQMYMDINIYDNFVVALDKSFVSPVSDFGRLTYKYYLTDSAVVDNRLRYKLEYKPRRKHELTFAGDMWVDAQTFALVQIRGEVSETANVNYVEQLMFDFQYTLVQDSIWFLQKEIIFADFKLTNKTMGFFGTKTTTRRNINILNAFEEKQFTAKTLQETVIANDANKKDENYWNTNRHEVLNEQEEQIYQLIDSIQQVPRFQTYYNLVGMISTGYYVHKKFEYGPYYKFFSFNELEGERLRFGGRTSNDFSTRWMFSGHTAYGFKDQKLKYGLGALFIINKIPRRAFEIYYKSDTEQLGQGLDAFTEDNIIGALFRRRPNDKLLLVDEFKSSYQHEWFEGFSNTLELKHRRLFANDYIWFTNTDTDTGLGSIATAEMRLNTRLAYNEKFVMGEFERMSLGSEYPILNIDFTIGLPHMFDSNYEYYKLDARLEHHFNINPFGEFKYRLNAGKIWGRVPFPLLHLHAGNETYSLDEYAFNMMNYYEFASDEYIGAFAEHHFQGFFLNKVPLFRKLKLREVVYAKAIVGRLNASNNQYGNLLKFPANMNELTTPYVEVGVGLENILKVLRIDAVWRLNYLDNPDIQVFGLRADLQLIL